MKKTENSPSMMISSVDQARLLADPTKLRIIQEIAITPRTTKQVADILGEKPTRLYRHVEALREAKLIKLVDEKQKRGTVEKYFLAVARRFEIHPDLFAPSSDGTDTVIDEMLSDTYNDIRGAIHEMHADPPEDEDLHPCFMKFAVRASESDIKELRKQLFEWLENCEKREITEPGPDDLHWSGLIAFYPDAKK